METILIMLGTFILVGVSFFMGFKLGRQQRISPVTDKEKDMATKMQEAFQNIMNYDIETAMGRVRNE